jgi:hypothetical protein
MTNDEDIKAVQKQLDQARKEWAKIEKLVRQRTNSNPKIQSSVNKTIVMSVLLYGAEIWVTNTTIMNKFTGFTTVVPDQQLVAT